MRHIDKLTIHEEIDHFGIKSHYVWHNGKQFYFSSGSRRTVHFSNYKSYIEGHVYPSIWLLKEGQKFYVKRFYNTY